MELAAPPAALYTAGLRAAAHVSRAWNTGPLARGGACSAAAAPSDEVPARGDRHGLRAVARALFAQHRLDVELGGALRHAQRHGDLLVLQALRQQGQHLLLPRRQRLDMAAGDGDEPRVRVGGKGGQMRAAGDQAAADQADAGGCAHRYARSAGRGAAPCRRTTMRRASASTCSAICAPAAAASGANTSNSARIAAGVAPNGASTEAQSASLSPSGTRPSVAVASSAPGCTSRTA